MTADFKLHLSWLDFCGYLSEFEDFVYNGVFHKMDYHRWRKLKDSGNNETQVIIEKCGDSFIVVIGHENEYHPFYRGDESFGDFLFKNLIDVKEYEHNLNTGKISSATTLEDKLADIGIMSIADDAGPTLSCVIDTKVDKAEFDKRLDDLTSKVESVLNKYENKKENSTMKGFNFDFGPMNNNVVRMSVYGMAVKNKVGTWVSYDAKAGEIIDVDVFNFDGSKLMYKMPVAINDVSIGDVIIHMSVPMFIVGKSKDGKAVYAVDPVAGERKEIMLTKSPFMFNFVTKVVNLLGDITPTADADNPFGNLLPLLLMEDKDNNDMFMAMMLMNNGNNGMNPMVLYALMNNKDKDSNILPLLLMNNMVISNQNQCHCKDNCN